MASRDHSPIRSSHLAAHRRMHEQQQQLVQHAVHYYHHRAPSQQQHRRGLTTPTSTTVSFHASTSMTTQLEGTPAWKAQAPPPKERDPNALSFAERNDIQRAQRGEVPPILDHNHDRQVVTNHRRLQQGTGVEVLHMAPPPTTTTSTTLDLALPQPTLFCVSGLPGVYDSYDHDDNTSTSQHSYMDDDTTATTVVATNTSKTTRRPNSHSSTSNSLGSWNMKHFMKNLAKRILIKDSPTALPTTGTHKKTASSSHHLRGNRRSKSVDSSSTKNTAAYRTPTSLHRDSSSRRSRSTNNNATTPPTTYESNSPETIQQRQQRRVVSLSSKSWDHETTKDLVAVASVPVVSSPLRRTGPLFPNDDNDDDDDDMEHRDNGDAEEILLDAEETTHVAVYSGSGMRGILTTTKQVAAEIESSTYHQIVLVKTESPPVDLDETPPCTSPEDSFEWLDHPLEKKYQRQDDSAFGSQESQEVSELSYYLLPSTRNLNDTYLDVPYQGPVDLDITVDSVTTNIRPGRNGTGKQPPKTDAADDDSLEYIGPLDVSSTMGQSDVEDENEASVYRNTLVADESPLRYNRSWFDQYHLADDDDRAVPSLAPHLVTPRKAAKHQPLTSASRAYVAIKQPNSMVSVLDLDMTAVAQSCMTDQPKNEVLFWKTIPEQQQAKSETIKETFLELHEKEADYVRKRPAEDSLSVAMMSSESVTSHTAEGAEQHEQDEEPANDDLDVSSTSSCSPVSFVKQQVDKWNRAARHQGPVDLDDSVSSELWASTDDGSSYRDCDLLSTEESSGNPPTNVKANAMTTKGCPPFPKATMGKSLWRNTSRPPLLPPPYHDSRKVSSIFGLPTGTTNAEALKRAQRRNGGPIDLDDTVYSECDDASIESADDLAAVENQRETNEGGAKDITRSTSTENGKPESMLGRRRGGSTFAHASNQLPPNKTSPMLEHDPGYSERLEMPSIDKSLNDKSGVNETSTRVDESGGFSNKTLDDTGVLAGSDDEESHRKSTQEPSKPMESSMDNVEPLQELLQAQCASMNQIAPKPLEAGSEGAAQLSPRRPLSGAKIDLPSPSSRLYHGVHPRNNQQEEQENLVPRNLKEVFEGNAMPALAGGGHGSDAFQRFERQLQELEDQMQTLELTQDSTFASVMQDQKNSSNNMAQNIRAPLLNPSQRDSPPLLRSPSQHGRRASGPVDLDDTVDTLNTTGNDGRRSSGPETARVDFPEPLNPAQKGRPANGPVDLDDTLNTTHSFKMQPGNTGRRSRGPVDLDVTLDSLNTTADVSGDAPSSTQRLIPSSRPPRLPPSDFDSRPKRLRRSKKPQLHVTIQEEISGGKLQLDKHGDDQPQSEQCATRGFEAIFDHLAEPPRVSGTSSPDAECARVTGSKDPADKKPQLLALGHDWDDSILQEDEIIWPEAFPSSQIFASTEPPLSAEGSHYKEEDPRQSKIFRPEEANEKSSNALIPPQLPRSLDNEWCGYISDPDEDLVINAIPVRYTRGSPAIPPHNRAASIEKPMHSWADFSSDQDDGNLRFDCMIPKRASPVQLKPAPALSNDSPVAAREDNWADFRGLLDDPKKQPAVVESVSPSMQAGVHSPPGFDFNKSDSLSDELSKSQLGYFPSMLIDVQRNNVINSSYESTAGSKLWEPEWFDFDAAAVNPLPAPRPSNKDSGDATRQTARSVSPVRPCVLEHDRLIYRKGYSAVMDELNSCFKQGAAFAQGDCEDSISSSDETEDAHENMISAIEHEIRGLEAEITNLLREDSPGEQLNVSGIEILEKTISGLEGKAALLLGEQLCQSFIGDGEPSQPSDEFSDIMHPEDNISPAKMKVKLPPNKTALPAAPTGAHLSMYKPIDTQVQEGKDEAMEELCRRISFELLGEESDDEDFSPRTTRTKLASDRVGITKLKARVLGNLSRIRSTSKKSPGIHDNNFVKRAEELLAQLSVKSQVVNQINRLSRSSSCTRSLNQLKDDFLDAASPASTCVAGTTKAPQSRECSAVGEAAATETAIIAAQSARPFFSFDSDFDVWTQEQGLERSPTNSLDNAASSKEAREQEPVQSSPAESNDGGGETLSAIVVPRGNGLDFLADFSRCESVSYASIESLESSVHSAKSCAKSIDIAPDDSLAGAALLADFDKETMVVIQLNFDHPLRATEPQPPARLCPETVDFDENPEVLTSIPVRPVVCDEMTEDEDEVIGRIFLGDFIDESGMDLDTPDIQAGNAPTNAVHDEKVDIKPVNESTTAHSATEAATKPRNEQTTADNVNEANTQAVNIQGTIDHATESVNELSTADLGAVGESTPDPKKSGIQKDPQQKTEASFNVSQNCPMTLEPIGEAAVPGEELSFTKPDVDPIDEPAVLREESSFTNRDAVSIDTDRFDHTSLDCMSALADDSSSGSSEDGDDDPSGYVLEDTLGSVQSEESLQFIDTPTRAPVRVREIPIVETVGFEEEFSDGEDGEEIVLSRSHVDSIEDDSRDHPRNTSKEWAPGNLNQSGLADLSASLHDLTEESMTTFGAFKDFVHDTLKPLKIPNIVARARKKTCRDRSDRDTEVSITEAQSVECTLEMYAEKSSFPRPSSTTRRSPSPSNGGVGKYHKLTERSPSGVSEIDSCYEVNSSYGSSKDSSMESSFGYSQDSGYSQSMSRSMNSTQLGQTYSLVRTDTPKRRSRTRTATGQKAIKKSLPRSRDPAGIMVSDVVDL